MKRALLLALLIACKRDSSSGLPPAKDWQGGAPPPSQQPAEPAQPANPHGGGGGMGQPGPVDPNGPNPHAGGMGMGDPSTPSQVPASTLDKLPDGKRALGPFAVAIPAEWKEKPVTSSMRAADFTITDDAELIVYYFGETGAGSVDANLDRWIGQFTTADGKPVKDQAKVDHTKIAGQDATVVSVSGHYQADAMMAGQSNVDKQDQELYAAIVDSPKGPYYFRAIGSKKTIDGNLDKIKAMLASMTVVQK